MPFYATYIGHINNGVFTSWDECRAEINKKPKYKKFATREEAEQFHLKGPFAVDNETFDITVYTDGACKKNGKADAKAGYGVFFSEGDPRNISKRLSGKVSNNIAEISAILAAFDVLKPELDSGKKCGIYTDSTYCLLCCGKYGEKCEKKGWPEDVPNVELVKTAFRLTKKYPNISLVHVTAHTLKTDTHSNGNRQADILATSSIS